MTRSLQSASAFVDEKIKQLADWRGRTLAKLRDIIHQTDPDIVENTCSGSRSPDGPITR